MIISFQYFITKSSEFISLDLIRLLEIELFLFFLFCIYISIKKSGITGIYTLFLFFTFIFNYSRFFLDLFTDYEIKFSDLFTRIILTNQTQITLLYLMLFFLLFGTLSFCIYNKKNKFSLKSDFKFLNTGIKLIKILSLPLLAIYIKQLFFVITHGYISIFNGDLARNTSFIELAIPRLMEYSFYIFLAGVPTEKEFKKYALIYSFLIFLSALKGQRGGFLLMLVMIVWYYIHVYEKKIKIRKILLIILSALIFSQTIVLSRVNKEISNYSFWDAPYDFLIQNSISVNVTAYVIQFYEFGLRSEGVPYFLAPIYDYFYRLFIDRSVFYGERTKALIEVSNYLSNDLIYYISPEAYYFGNGTGSSYMAELYDFGGLFGGSLILFLLVKFIMKWEYKLNYSRFLLFLSPLVLMKFIYIPRDSFFKIIDEIFILIIMYYLIKFLIKENSYKISL